MKKSKTKKGGIRLKKNAVIIAALIIVIIVSIIAIVFNQKDNDNNVGVFIQSIMKSKETQTADIHADEARSKITGKWISKELANNTPIAVMYSNVYDAMPQSSISYADIVFESLVEGGITRLCGVFENCNTLDKIGPVRSCRTYYLFFAKEFEATYVHFGYSDYAKEYLDKKEMHSLDGMVYCDFYRTNDRIAPHNAYTSWQGIMKSADAKGYPQEYSDTYTSPFTFNQNDDTDVVISGGSTCLTFKPGYVYNKPWFVYNESDKLYYRFQFDEAQIDKETNRQLAYKNILVKYVTGNYYPNGTPNYITDGAGKGVFITDGKAIDVTWRKDSEYGSTKYYYNDGTQVILNQGKTWICQIEENHKEAVKILDTVE